MSYGDGLGYAPSGRSLAELRRLAESALRSLDPHTVEITPAELLMLIRLAEQSAAK